MKLRKYLLQHYEIHAIVSLPKGVFRPYVKSNKTDIIILEKSEDRNPKGTTAIWFYDLRQDGFDLNSDLRPEIEQNDIPDLLDKWSGRPNSEKSWLVDIEKIKEKNYDLMAKTYQETQQYTSQYRMESFSEIMKENKTVMTIDDEQEYRLITVQLNGRGVIPRRRGTVKQGKKIKTKKQKLTKTNQFIVAELDAKYGAFGIIPEELAGSIVSSHYFLFDLDPHKILPEYFDYVIRRGPYTEIIQPKVKGTTNYASIRPKRILELKIPLPSISGQRNILDTINKKKERLIELEKAKEQATRDIQDIVNDLFRKQ